MDGREYIGDKDKDYFLKDIAKLHFKGYNCMKISMEKNKAIKNKILIIDDDTVMCEEISDLLVEEGYDVAVSCDELNVYERIKEGLYSLIILDLKMPRISGFDILRFIEENGIKVKVIVVSGIPLASRLPEEKGLTNSKNHKDLLSNVDTFISKPFNLESLLAKIKELI